MPKIRVPKFLKEDLLRKIVALFFAVLIWVVVNNQLRQFEIFYDIPVYISADHENTWIGETGYTTAVKLRGPKQQLENLKSSDIGISAEIPRVARGVYSYDLHLSASDVETPPGIHVGNIRPDSFDIPVDTIITGDVPIEPREQGELSHGYEINSRKVVPPEVTVKGPSKVIREIKEVQTEPVALDDTVTENFQVSDVGLRSMARVEVYPRTVSVSYEVERVYSKKVFDGLPLHGMRGESFNMGVSFTRSTVSVIIRGPQDKLDELKPRNVLPFIELTGNEGPGRFTREVNVWFPAISELKLGYVQPGSVSVTLLPKENKQE